jgi:hypothetical protein
VLEEEVMKVRKIFLFIGFLAVNCLLVYLANQLLPDNFVLGNARLNPLAAAGVSGLLITVLIVVGVVVKAVGNKMNKTLEAVVPTLVYFWVVNFVAFWAVARMAEVSGLGVSKFTYAAGWAVVADVAQWGVWIVLGAKKEMSESVERETEKGEQE